MHGGRPGGAKRAQEHDTHLCLVGLSSSSCSTLVLCKEALRELERKAPIRMAGMAALLSPDVLLLVFLMVISSLLLGSRRKSLDQKKLPPGDVWSMPVVGETRAFLKQPYKFLDQKREKYGGIFRTSIFGQTSAVLSTPESAKFVLVQAHKSFRHGYRASIARITDPAGCFMNPEMNARVRKLLAATLGPENVHGRIPAYDALTLSVIDAWKDGATVNTKEEMETITMKCMLHLLWAQQDCQKEYEEIYSLHDTMNKGNLAAFPINLPFTAYGKAMQACKEFQDFLFQRIAQARETRSGSRDVLSALVHEEMEDGSKLTDAQISSVATTLIFAGYRSTAISLVWIFKFLHDNPEVFSEVKAEHMALKNSKKSDRDPLIWDDLKKMPLTMKVMKESMRLAPVVKFMSRVSLDEVEYNGYVIPKGWRTYVSYQFHFDPKLYPDPLKFDPSRFDVPTKPNTFIPFGNGPHLCVGYQFPNTIIPIVIHRVVTSFSFKPDGEGGVVFWPHYVPEHGYPLKIERLAGYVHQAH